MCIILNCQVGGNLLPCSRSLIYIFHPWVPTRSWVKVILPALSSQPPLRAQSPQHPQWIPSRQCSHQPWQRIVSSAANLLPKLVVKERSICPTFNIIISIVCTTPSQGSAHHRPPIILSCFSGNGWIHASRLLPPPTWIICNFHTSVLACWGPAWKLGLMLGGPVKNHWFEKLLRFLAKQSLRKEYKNISLRQLYWSSTKIKSKELLHVL